MTNIATLIIDAATWPLATIHSIVSSMISDMLGGPGIYLFGLAIIAVLRVAARLLFPASIYALAGMIAYAAVASAAVVVIGPHHEAPTASVQTINH